MSGSGKGVSGVVGISRNGSGAGTFPDITPSLRHFTLKCAVVGAGGGDDFLTAKGWRWWKLAMSSLEGSKFAAGSHSLLEWGQPLNLTR